MDEDLKNQKKPKNGKEKKVTENLDITSITWEEIDIPEKFDMKNYMELIERGLIKNAMKETGNNKNKAAKYLGLNRTTLIEKIKKKNLIFP